MFIHILSQFQDQRTMRIPTCVAECACWMVACGALVVVYTNATPLNMPDPIRKRSDPAIAGLQSESAGIVYARSDFPIPFQFRFSQEGMDHIAQNRPGSDLDGLLRVWPNTSGLEVSWCAGNIGPGFWQDATGPLPVSDFQTRFRSSTDVSIILCKTRPDPISFWLIVSGLPKGSGPEAKPVCRNHPARFWPMLPGRSGPDANRIRHV